MSRYIDSDLLVNKIFPLGIGDGMYTINAKALKVAIDSESTAEVVPKSEVARKIFMDIDRVVEKYSMGDIEYPEFVDIIAELKKKYTEEKL